MHPTNDDQRYFSVNQTLATIYNTSLQENGVADFVLLFFFLRKCFKKRAIVYNIRSQILDFLCRLEETFWYLLGFIAAQCE